MGSLILRRSRVKEEERRRKAAPQGSVLIGCMVAQNENESETQIKLCHKFCDGVWQRKREIERWGRWVHVKG